MATKLYTEGQLCSIQGCTFEHHGRAQRLTRGLCPKHYVQGLEGREYLECANDGCSETENLYYGKCVLHKGTDPAKLSANQKRFREKFGKTHDRRNNLKRNFGITVADYDSQLEAQDYSCAICGASATATSRRFAVDHDHETGELRGLLCGPCNLGLGHFKDNPERLEAAITYLQTGGVWVE